MDVCDIPLEIGTDWGADLWLAVAQIKSNWCDWDKRKVNGGVLGGEDSK